MADCDMCGLSSSKLISMKIEGTIMNVCPNCARYGNSLESPSKRVNNFTSNHVRREYVDPDANKIITNNFSSIVKNARERKGLKQEQVAKQLNEKESLIHSIESGSLKPRFKTARKLEKFFKIHLIEEITNFSKDKNISSNEEAKPLTMGDLLKKAMKK
jgi:putative transcription factor